MGLPSDLALACVAPVSPRRGLLVPPGVTETCEVAADCWAANTFLSRSTCWNNDEKYNMATAYMSNIVTFIKCRVLCIMVRARYGFTWLLCSECVYTHVTTETWAVPLLQNYLHCDIARQWDNSAPLHSNGTIAARGPALAATQSSGAWPWLEIRWRGAKWSRSCVSPVLFQNRPRKITYTHIHAHCIQTEGNEKNS